MKTKTKKHGAKTAYMEYITLDVEGWHQQDIVPQMIKRRRNNKTRKSDRLVVTLALASLLNTCAPLCKMLIVSSRRF